MSTPRVYTTELSVKPNDVLQVCASYDDGSVVPSAAYARIVRVTEIDTLTFSNLPIPPNTLMAQQSILPGTGPAVWNRDEVG